MSTRWQSSIEAPDLHLTIGSIKDSLTKRLEEVQREASGKTASFSGMRFERKAQASIRAGVGRHEKGGANRTRGVDALDDRDVVSRVERDELLVRFSRTTHATHGEGNRCAGDYTCGVGQRCSIESPPPVCVTGQGLRGPRQQMRKRRSLRRRGTMRCVRRG